MNNEQLEQLQQLINVVCGSGIVNKSRIYDKSLLVNISLAIIAVASGVISFFIYRVTRKQNQASTLIQVADRLENSQLAL